MNTEENQMGVAEPRDKFAHALGRLRKVELDLIEVTGKIDFYRQNLQHEMLEAERLEAEIHLSAAELRVLQAEIRLEVTARENAETMTSLKSF